MRTYSPRPAQIQRQWHLLDGAGQTVGRLATQAATLLVGKHKVVFVRHLDVGDHVVIINSAQVAMTGKKEQHKELVRHSGYPGGLKTVTWQELKRTNPGQIIKHAVSGMLPKNKLRDKALKRLYLVSGTQNPYAKYFSKEPDKKDV